MQFAVRTTKTILAFVVGAVVFLDYWSYSQQFYREPAVYTDVLQGTATAPNQYRIGVVLAASFIANHGHMGLRHAMTLLDGLSAAIAAYLLYSLLRRSTVYQSANNQLRWFASAAFVVLVQFYLLWLTWYQRPETLPTAAMVAVALWLLTPGPNRASTVSHLLTVASLLLLAAAQGLVRADVTVALHAGILLVSLTALGRGFSLPRPAQAFTSMLSIAIGAATQYYMMRIAYPHASYGSTPVFQLGLNLTDKLRIVPFVIFMLPFAWTLVQVVRRRFAADTPAVAMLTATVLFLPLWCVLGKIDEVRIFLPFALALAPLTVALLMQRIAEAG